MAMIRVDKNWLKQEMKEIKQKYSNDLPKDIAELPKGIELSSFLALAQLNTNTLAQRAENGRLSREKFRLLLIYKLIPRLGLLPLRFASDSRTKNMLYDAVYQVFGSKGSSKSLKSLSSSYKSIKHTLEKPKEVGIEIKTEKGLQTSTADLTGSYREFKKIIAGEIGKGREILKRLSTNGNQMRQDFYNEACKNAGLQMEYCVMQEKVGNLIQAQAADDPILVNKSRLSSNIASLENEFIRPNDHSEELKWTFYILKLFKDNTVSADDIPRGSGFVIGQYVTLFSLPSDLKKLLNDLRENVFLSEDTQRQFTEQLKRLKEQEATLISENSEKKASKYFGVSLSKDEKEQSSTSKKSSNFLRATPDKSKAEKRHKFGKLFAGARMKFYIYKLSKLAKTYDDKRWKPEIEKLVQDYSRDKTEQDTYREELIKKVRLVQFTDTNESELKEFFDVSRKLKKQIKKPGNLPVETLKLYRATYSAKDFDDFASMIFNQYYIDDKKWQGMAGDIKSILEEHIFNIEKEILSKSKALNSKETEVKITGQYAKIPENEDEKKKFLSGSPVLVTSERTITIPSRYLELKRDTSERLSNMFKHGESDLLPRAKQKLKIFEPYSDPSDLKVFYVDIQRSLVLDKNGKKNIISNWNTLFKGNTTEYESCFEEIISSGKQYNLTTSKGKLKELLNFIWLIYVNYDPQIFETRYNLLMKQLDEKIAKAVSAAQATHKDKFGSVMSELKGKVKEADSGTTPPPAHLPPEAINMPNGQGNTKKESKKASDDNKMPGRVANLRKKFEQQLGGNSGATEPRPPLPESKNIGRANVSRLRKQFESEAFSNGSKDRQ